MNLFEKQQKPFAIKLSDRVKEEIKKTFDTDWYDDANKSDYFHYPNTRDFKGFKKLNHVFHEVFDNYTLITEAEFFGDGNNKLREKIHELGYADTFGKLEQIAYDFAVKFAEWLRQEEIKSSTFEDGIGDKSKKLTTTELLQIFKENHYE